MCILNKDVHRLFIFRVMYFNKDLFLQQQTLRTFPMMKASNQICHFFLRCWVFISSTSFPIMWLSTVVSVSMSRRISIFSFRRLFSSSSCTFLFLSRCNSLLDPFPPDSVIHCPSSNFQLWPPMFITGGPYSRPSSTSLVERSNAWRLDKDAHLRGGIFFGLNVFPKRGIFSDFLRSWHLIETVDCLTGGLVVVVSLKIYS